MSPCRASVLAFATALVGCGSNPCDDLGAKYRACSDGGETEAEATDCNEAEEACSQCYLDSAKDLCTELDAISLDCADVCSQL